MAAITRASVWAVLLASMTHSLRNRGTERKRQKLAASCTRNKKRPFRLTKFEIS